MRQQSQRYHRAVALEAEVITKHLPEREGHHQPKGEGAHRLLRKGEDAHQHPRKGEGDL